MSIELKKITTVFVLWVIIGILIICLGIERISVYKDKKKKEKKRK